VGNKKNRPAKLRREFLTQKKEERHIELFRGRTVYQSRGEASTVEPAKTLLTKTKKKRSQGGGVGQVMDVYCCGKNGKYNESKGVRIEPSRYKKEERKKKVGN